MKNKFFFLALSVVLILAVASSILFLDNGNKDLSSKSIDGVGGAEGADPRPAVESLDGVEPDQTVAIDREKLLQELQQELLKIENDPERTLEIRRQIQSLKTEQ